MTDLQPEPANEADVLEQRTGVHPDEESPEPPGDVGEADPADVHDQRLTVPDDEDLDRKLRAERPDVG